MVAGRMCDCYCDVHSTHVLSPLRAAAAAADDDDDDDDEVLSDGGCL